MGLRTRNQFGQELGTKHGNVFLFVAIKTHISVETLGVLGGVIHSPWPSFPLKVTARSFLLEP